MQCEEIGARELRHAVVGRAKPIGPVQAVFNGLGGKLTTWVALGLDKELSARWSSVTDLGVMYQYWRETQKTTFNTNFNLMLDVIVR